MKQINILGIVLWATLTAVAQPTITQPPANQTVALGDTLTLSVTAGGTTPAYQWFKDSRLLVGATNSTLTVANAGVTNSGAYYVVVTNSGGMVISLPALVTVGNPSLLAWGYNYYGDLGNGSNIDTNMPITVVSNVVAGSTGYGFSMFVTADGKLWAMGWNIYGELGNGTTSDTNRPVSVANNVVAVAAGGYHTMFIKSDGTLWGMGMNGAGELGNGITFAYTNRPMKVFSNVVAVAAGLEHSLFVKTDGTLWAMGRNNYGQLGNGISSGTNPNPTPVCVASNVVAVAAGNTHSLFLKTDMTLWAMGDNSNGDLGNGKTSQVNTPISVASNVVAVAAGVYHSLFIKTDGTLWAMGNNNYGQLGNGKFTTNPNSTPICVASNVVAMAAGAYHSLFTTTNGTLWTMGENNFGQLGNGTMNDSSQPVSLPHIPVASVFQADHAWHSLVIGFNYNGTVTMSNLSQLYTGSAISVTASTMPPGLSVNLTYNGSLNAPTNAGNYTVTGVISDPNYYGNVTNTLVINPIPATVTLTNLSQLYTGNAISVTASTTPPGLTVNLTYNGSPNAPTNAGNYAITGVISDPNYYGIATNTLVVGQSPQSFGVSSTNSQQLTLQLTGTPNYPYILESATNLTPPMVWLPVFTNYADTNGNWNFTITGLTNTPAGYYRAVAQ